MSDKCACACGLPGCASRRGKGHPKRGTPGKLPVDLPTLVHNKAGYDRGCRCVTCVRSNSVDTMQQKKRRNAITQDTAHRRYQQWTGPELEIALRPDLTAAEAAVLIGRTMHSVKNARKKARIDPRFIRLAGVPK